MSLFFQLKVFLRVIYYFVIYLFREFDIYVRDRRIFFNIPLKLKISFVLNMIIVI